MIELPKWGVMVAGKVQEFNPPSLSSTRPASGWIPTPRVQNADGRPIRARDLYKANLEEYMGIHFPDLIGQHVPPTYVEHLMGWPIGWTSKEPLSKFALALWRACFEVEK